MKPKALVAPLCAPFDDLHRVSLAHVVRLLESYGNEISSDHKAALSALCELSSRILSDQLEGRVRFALPCGMGKTTTIRAVLLSIYELGLPARVVVASSKVEELCALMRTLIDEDGLPPEFIGLQHSYHHSPARAKEGQQGFASEPSRNHDAQFLLVTHANVRSGEVRPWMDRCDLVFFDESLIVGQPLSLPLVQPPGAQSVFDELCRLEGHAQLDHQLRSAATACRELFDQLFSVTKSVEGNTVGVVPADRIDAQAVKAARQALANCPDAFDLLPRMLEWSEAATELRVFCSSDDRMILLSYAIAVPDSLNNVIVLDASDPVRELVHHDDRMVRAEEVLPSLAPWARIPGGLASIKLHGNVSVFHACDAAGRHTVTGQLRAEKTPWLLEKVTRLLLASPDEGFLIFVHKGRGDDRTTDLPRRLYAALTEAGIDPDAQVPTGDLAGETVSRVRIETWGRETGTNEFSSYKNVILLGVARKPEDVVAATYLGQVDNLRCPKLKEVVRRLSDSECRHMLYQAMNRTRMRRTMVVNGHSQACPTNVYVWHFDPDLEVELRKVLHGCPRWRPWREPGEGLTASDITMNIRAELERLQEQGQHRVSMRALKAAVAPNLPKSTWSRARNAAVELTDWWRQGNVLFYGFPSSSTS